MPLIQLKVLYVFSNKLSETTTINKERLNQTVKEDFSNATELADYLETKIFHLELHMKL